MALSIFTTATDPYRRGDLYEPAMKSYEFADEVVVIDGTHKDTYWPTEFSWELIGQQFQKGYERSSGDWVIHCDLDFIFHERDYGKVKQAIKDYPSAPAISFYKWQFIQPDRYNLKSRLPLAVNKAAFGDRIKFNGGGDLCQPTLDGNELDLNEIPQAGVPIYNYEHILKSRAQLQDDVCRMDRAYMRYFDRPLYSTNGDAYEGWLEMMIGRYNKPSKKIPLSDHPKIMQKVIQNLRPDQWGYNGFRNFEGGYHAQSS